MLQSAATDWPFSACIFAGCKTENTHVSRWAGSPFQKCSFLEALSTEEAEEMGIQTLGKVYNSCMGGVDKADMLLSLYRTRYRCRKWYHRIAFHFFSLAATNSWVIFRQLGGRKPLVRFLSELCASLIMGGAHHAHVDDDTGELPGCRSMRAKDIPQDIRFDKYDHWPVLMDIANSQRCKYESCIKKTKYQCSKCKVYLCVANNVCFRAFHGVE